MWFNIGCYKNNDFYLILISSNIIFINYSWKLVKEKMNDKKKHADNCGCEHHSHGNHASHHMDGKCSSDLFADNLIEILKKDFEKDSE